MELDKGGELVLVQIYFNAACDRVNHGGLVFKLQEAGVGGMILKVFQIFLSSRTQRVRVLADWQLLIVSFRQLKVQNGKYAFNMMTAHWQLFLSGKLKVVRRLRPAQ